MIFQAVYSTSHRSAVLAFGVSDSEHSDISQVTLRSVFCPTLTFEPSNQSIRCIRRSNLRSRIHEFKNFHCVYPFMSETFGGSEIHWQHVLDRRIRSLRDKLSSNAKREYWISASDFVGNSRCLLLKGFENLFECFCKYTYIYMYLSVCGFCLGCISCMWYN